MSNVVQLKAPKKAKRRAKSPLPVAADEALIRECIIFAQNVAAFDASFTADPNGDWRYGEPMSERFRARLYTALRKMSTPATTPEGLDAKARVLPIVIHNAAGNPCEPFELQFFTTFAADVRKLLEPIIQQRFEAAKAAQGSKE